MSKTVVVEKVVDVEIVIKIDYLVCEACNREVNFDVSSNSYGDLQIKVDKCDCGR